MLFNSLPFFIFLGVSFGLYWLTPKRSRLQNLCLLAVSLFFYGWWDWRFLGLILGSVLWTYLFARKRWNVTLGVGGILLVLCLFKYYNFFIDSIGAATSLFSISTASLHLNLIMPLGISFYSFMCMGYLLDVHWKKIEPERDLVAFSSFMMFFPQIAAGPIGRADKMLPQYHATRHFDYALAVEGCRQMLWGFVKKILVADTCAASVAVLLKEGQVSSVCVWLGVVIYTIQIYADFSGYSDLAIGCGKLFGIRLMRNFDYPYFARNIADFWRRWHMSLTTWFRDYIYIPLGGGRCDISRKIFNTLVVFLVSGIWHGAGWTFVLWGAFHGLCFIPFLLRGKDRKPLPTVLATFMTVMAALFGWVLFRAPDIATAGKWYGMMLCPRNFSLSGVSMGVKPLAFAAGMFLNEWIGRKAEIFPVPKTKWLRMLYYTVLILLIFVFYPETENYIYFQF